jgi:hypothetical protein
MYLHMHQTHFYILLHIHRIVEFCINFYCVICPVKSRNNLNRTHVVCLELTSPGRLFRMLTRVRGRYRQLQRFCLLRSANTDSGPPTPISSSVPPLYPVGVRFFSWGEVAGA